MAVVCFHVGSTIPISVIKNLNTNQQIDEIEDISEESRYRLIPLILRTFYAGIYD